MSAAREKLEKRRLEAAADLGTMKQSDLARKYGISRTTASRWCLALQKLGTDGLKLRKATGRPKRLSKEQLAELKKVTKGKDLTTQEFADLIHTYYGIRYHADYAGRIGHQLHANMFAGHRGSGARRKK